MYRRLDIPYCMKYVRNYVRRTWSLLFSWILLHLQVPWIRIPSTCMVSWTHCQLPWLLLHHAAENGKKEVLGTVLEACSSGDPTLINRQKETDGNTALHVAAQAGHVASVQTLLYFYPDVKVTNHHDEVAMYIAAKSGHWELFHTLLQYRDPSVGLRAHFPPPDNMPSATIDALLQFAVQGKQIDVIRMLIELGANVNQIDDKVIICFLLQFDRMH
jgi:ankyrin repeat protein